MVGMVYKKAGESVTRGIKARVHGSRSLAESGEGN